MSPIDEHGRPLRYDRRTFIRLGASTVAGVALVGCSPADPSTSPTASAEGGTPATGTRPSPAITQDLSNVIYGELYPDLPRGGSLEIGITQISDSLHILATTEGATSWQADPAHDFLERYNHKGELVPSLAESMEVVDDTTLRYVLRSARFHNGREVTADDVRQTVEWVQDPANGSGRASVYEGVEVEVEDDRTLLLRLPEPDAGFRHNLPRLPVVPIEAIDSQAEAPVGCGPFVFKEWVRGSYINYDRNPDYWNPEAPRLDSLRITTLADTQAAASSFLAGELDFVEGIPVGLASEFSARADAGDINVATIFPGWVFIGFQNEREPFDNTAFKRAINLALDRTAIATAFGGPLGAEPISVGPVPPNSPWFPSDLTVERNVEEARSLMAEAGFENGYSGPPLVLRIEQWAGSADAGVVAQSNLAEIGIDIQLEVTDSATYVDRRESGDFDMYLSGWFMAPDPAFVLDSLFITGASSNSWRYSNEEVDSLLEEARTILDDDERRRKLYHRAIEITFIEEPAMLAVCTEPNFYAYVTTTNGDQYRPDPGPLFHYPIASTSA